MTQEIVRELVGGIWRTARRQQAGGGGSQPTLIVQTIGFAEIAAAWDADLGTPAAAIQITGIDPGTFAANISEAGSTLDGNVRLASSGGIAYLPGQPTQDVVDNGEGVLRQYQMDEGTYRSVAGNSGNMTPNLLLAGAVFYAIFKSTDDTPPTEGETTLYIPVWLP